MAINHLYSQTFIVVLYGYISLENYWNHFISHRENLLEEFRKFFILHIMSKLMSYLHNSNVFDVILEKRCIKFFWTMLNSTYDLYRTITTKLRLT